jgi:hypothetical protein
MTKALKTNPLSRLIGVFVRHPSLLLLSVFIFWSLIFWMKGSLTAPASGDEGDYIGRGITLTHQGLSAISDGFRPPFFVFICAAVSYLVGDNFVLTGVRLLNIAFVSAIPWVWLSAYRSSGRSNGTFGLMAIFTSVWPLYYFFASRVYAEAISFLLLNLLLLLALSFSNQSSHGRYLIKSIVFGAIIAALTLSKANNLLIAPPCALLAFLQLNTKFFYKVTLLLVSVITCIVMMFPWISLVQKTTDEYNLSTTGGVNLLVGTGRYYFGMADELDLSMLPDRYIGNHLKFHQTPRGPSALSSDQEHLLDSAKTVWARDDVSKAISMQIWHEDRTIQSVYGLTKVIHSVGGSMRGLSDYFSIAFLGLTIICSLYCLKVKTNRQIVLTHWLFALSGFFVAFFYLPNIRFESFYFDTTGLLLCAASLHILWGKTLKQKLDFSLENRMEPGTKSIEN